MSVKNPSIILTYPLLHVSRFPPKTRWKSPARHVDVVSRSHPMLPLHPSVAFARRAVVAISSRRGGGKSFWINPHIFFLYIKTGRRKKMGRPFVSAPSQSGLRANRASPHNLAEPLLRGRC